MPDGGYLLIQARQHVGVSQCELARRLGKYQPQVSRWETGRSEITVHDLERALDAIGLRLELAWTA